VKHQRDAREFPTRNRRSSGADLSTAAPRLLASVGLLAGATSWADLPLNRRRGRVKPVSEDKLGSCNFSNVRVVSLEGFRAFAHFNAFSDKPAPFGAFDSKQLIGAVRKNISAFKGFRSFRKVRPNWRLVAARPGATGSRHLNKNLSAVATDREA
jgi:hypothetical protein